MTVHLSSQTTLGLGGPAARMVTCRDEQTLVDTVRTADRGQARVLLIGSGSNLVVADEGFPGTVIRVRTRGIRTSARNGRVWIEVQAGEPWDGLVARAVRDGLAGIECLSGIPGTVGATPVQNVGAYDQAVEDRIARVRVYDRHVGDVYELRPEECAFDYRSSIFKRNPNRWVILSVSLALVRQDFSFPVQYRDLCDQLRLEQGDRVPLATMRMAVLEVRRRKGMVLDPEDTDTNSAGSFFMNPIISRSELRSLENRICSILGPAARVPVVREVGEGTQIRAAWLIRHAGFTPGYGSPNGIAISSKHVLALTNRGQGTTKELVALASRIASVVYQRFGIELRPEPEFVGVIWPGVHNPTQYNAETQPTCVE